MHRHDSETERLTEAIVQYAVERIRMDPPPLDGPRSPDDLRAAIGTTITPTGIGGLEALRRFAEVLAPACISVDHPRFLAFVPAAPTEASILFDLVVGASSIYAGSYLEGAGAVFAENEALRWLADLAGLPKQAGGVFVSGGTAGNLASLIVARFRWRQRADGAFDRTRGIVLCSAAAHSSIGAAARVLDVDIVEAEADERGRLGGDALRRRVATLGPLQRSRVFAVVATAGTTNAGVVDDLSGAADVAADLGAWFHVDGAYGGAGLLVPRLTPLYAGVGHADSFIVDPHKWLFAPFDSCALLYRDTQLARRAHTQHAEYLEVLHDDTHWNPSDYAHHLSRRARGLPFWFSLATHGTVAYRTAIEATLDVAAAAARVVDDCPYLELLMEPELSVVLFHRTGWSDAQHQSWCDEMLTRGQAFVVPSSWDGRMVLRLCFVNPNTTVDDVRALVESLA